MTARGGEQGSSLLELLLSLSLTALVMALTVPFAHVEKRIWERGEERRESSRALAGALSWLTRDLQQAGYHCPGSPLQEIAPQSLRYTVSRDEADPAGFSPDNRRLVTLWLDGADLKYRIQAPLEPPASGWESGSTQVLASGIGSLRCRGLDGDGVETALASAAALVECVASDVSGVEARLLVRLRTGGRGGSSS